VVVQDEQLPYRYVVVECAVVDTTTPTPIAVQHATALRYLGDDGARAFMQEMAGKETVMFTIRPNRWVAVDFSGIL